MAALVAEHPNLHLTINLTPGLLWQLEDYVDHGATDRTLDLTLKPAAYLTAEEREFVLSNFFDAHWHNQIFPYPRDKELFVQCRAGQRFSAHDVRDLQMWFNLAWFGQEFRDGDVALVRLLVRLIKPQTRFISVFAVRMWIVMVKMFAVNHANIPYTSANMRRRGIGNFAWCEYAD